MLFLTDPSVNVIFYKLALFLALMVMAYFEARLYTHENILSDKRPFYRISFLANAIVGLFLFLPVYEFDLIVMGLYLLRTIVVGRFYIRLNHKKTTAQARTSVIFLFFKVLGVFVVYNMAFFLMSLLFGTIQAILIGFN